MGVMNSQNYSITFAHMQSIWIGFFLVYFVCESETMWNLWKWWIYWFFQLSSFTWIKFWIVFLAHRTFPTWILFCFWFDNKLIIEFNVIICLNNNKTSIFLIFFSSFALPYGNRIYSGCLETQQKSINVNEK